MEDKESGLNLIRSKPHLILLSTCSGLGNIVQGYQTAAISGSIFLIKDEFGLGDNDKILDAIISSLLGTALIGAVVGGIIADIHGRRYVLVIAAVFNVIGSIIMSAGSTAYDILAGRLIIGLGIGAGSVASPLLIAESVPPENRGAFISLNDFQIFIGQFIGHVTNLVATKFTQPWRSLSWIGLIPAVIQLMMLFFLDESPTINLKKKKIEKARVSLQKTHDVASVEAKLKRMQSIVDREENVSFNIKRNFLLVSILKGATLQICQKCVGVGFVLAQAPMIFQIGGFNSKSTASLILVLLSALSLVGSVVGALVVDRASRKKMMLISLGVLLFGFATLSFFFYNQPAVSPTRATTTVIATKCISKINSNCYKCLKQGCDYCSNTENFKVGWCVDKLRESEQSCWDKDGVLFDAGCPRKMGFLAIGMLFILVVFAFPIITSIPTIVNSEIHPMKYRGGGGGVVAATGWGTNFLVNLPVFSSVAKSTFGKTMFFGGLTVSAILIISLLKIPDTKSKQLEDVEVFPPNTKVTK